VKAIQLVIKLRFRSKTAGSPAACECRGHRRLGAAQVLAVSLLATWSALGGFAQGQTIVTDTGAPTSSFMAPLSMPGLQPFWVGYVGADRGLGFQGQYFSFGGLLPITTDMLDGTWFFDGRAHVTTDNAQFFSNAGIGRRQYIGFLNSIVGLSGWYDYDGDAYQNYGYRYNQLGVTAEVFNPAFDFRFNGYMPMGNTTHVLNQFEQNYLLYVNGIDTALRGGDAKFSVRPAILGPLNGYIDIGGYFFKSSAIEGFGGVSSGFGVQPLPGLAVNLEVNHDQLFGTTGFVRVAFGLRGSPGNTRTGSRLLEPTRRNDHIVRFNQQPEIATNPQTSVAYNVIHVDNTAAAGGNGTIDHPFQTLAAAQAASAIHDIIYVHKGDGTSHDYANGIILKDNQMLLGSGNNYVVQTTEIGPMLLKALDSSQPVISNPNGAGVTLANNDRVGGITISVANVGIVGNNITNTTLEQNTVYGGLIDGIQLTNFSGAASIVNNSIRQNAQDGIHIIEGAANATYSLVGNTVDSNVRNGIFFDDTHGSAVVDDNTLGSNGRGNWAGVQVAQTSGTMDIEIKNNTIQYNTEGIYLTADNAGGNGATINADIHDNPEISYNQGDGIQIAARHDATADFNIHDNPNISYNGYPEGVGVGRTTAGGAGIRLYTLDSSMGGIINHNGIIDNAGTGNPVGNEVDQAAGIQGQFDGNSVTSFIITNNNIDGLGTNVAVGRPYGDGVWLDYEITNSIIQNLLVTNNQIVNNKGLGFQLSTAGRLHPGITSTLLDATFDNNNISNNFFSGLYAFQGSSAGVMRLTVTNNQINNNVSPTSGGQGLPSNDGGLSLESNSGRLVGIIENNVINANGLTPNNSTNSPRASGINGIAATIDESNGLMGLQIIGNQINGNQHDGILLTDNNVINPGVGTALSMGAIIHDNFIMFNGGDAGVQAVTPNIGTPPGPNVSTLGVELTHNESSLRYHFLNLQGITPNTALITFADGGLNAGLFDTSLSVGSVAATTAATMDALVAPLLIFP
jgi:hypothetical protein